MTKKERAAIAIERLKEEYPDAGCTLDYNEAWKLLVSVRLAAQCTDERVNVIVRDLLPNIRVWTRWQRREPEDYRSDRSPIRSRLGVRHGISANVCGCSGMSSEDRCRIILTT